MDDFNTTDFVQVEHFKMLENGQPISFWRNALYVMRDNENHVVVYTGGDRHILNDRIRIRKAQLNKR